MKNGSKRKRNGDAWQLIVTIGTDYRGKPQRFYRTVHGTEKQADKELMRFYIECEEGIASRSSALTISGFWDIFVEEYCNAKLKDSTVKRYDTFYQKQIAPAFGSRKMNSIQRLDVQKWINSLDVSAKTVHGAWSVLNTMYECAIRWDMVKDNPCGHIELPKQIKAEADFYTLDELDIVIPYILADIGNFRAYKTLVLLDLFTGLRISEIAGLKWCDIDAERHTISIKRQRQHITGKGDVVTTPKTANAVRTISYPAFMHPLLAELKNEYINKAEMLKEEWTDDTYVLLNDDLTPKSPRMLSQWWRTFDIPNVRKITFHQLRHTHTAILAHIGVDKYDITDRLGHSTFSTTLRTYMHILEHKEDAIADGLDSFVVKMLPSDK